MYNYKKLTTFYVQKLTFAAINYREHALFSCPNELCLDGNTSNSYYISMHVAGASEAATVGKEWTCYSCGSLLVENVSCRTLSGIPGL